MPAPNELDSVATFNNLYAKLVAIPGLQTVYKGIPEQYTPQVAAAIAATGQRIQRKANTFFERWAGYYIEFAYRTQGAEQAAEEKLMACVDSLIKSVEGDKTLGGTALDVELEVGLSDTPQYALMRGFEERFYPCLVRAKQKHNVAVNP